ncbi:hypothetical protein CKF94_15995 [Vibrio coralliilyticus]|uniref:immunity 49 family protein n=1 Tax=Vibrio coralliilyticus TaxID=190893 RepID=UPI000BAAF813|nr:immunity 49 family protein [Vibrio coralliilyticus]PAU37385.1 hypothetical protein CKF94_15995 [Vibrio coralliilyticus]
MCSKIQHHIELNPTHVERVSPMLPRELINFYNNQQFAIKRKPENAVMGGNQAIGLLGKLQRFDWDKPTAQWLLQEAAELMTVGFSIALNPDRQVMCQYAGFLFEAEGKTNQTSRDFFTWLNAFSLALITRDKELLETIWLFEESNIVPEPGGWSFDPEDRFIKSLLAMLKGMFNPNADMAALIKTAAEMSAPEYIDPLWRDEANHLYVPLIPLVASMYTSDRNEAYPQAIEQAIRTYRAYFDLPAPDDSPSFGWNSSQWVSFPITALASLAFQRYGLEPQVESYYLPLWWVKGDIPNQRLRAEDVLDNL